MIEIRTVDSKKDMELFVDFRTDLYKADPMAVPYLFKDEMDTLSPKKNPALAFCDTRLYMAWRDGKPVGRVAAIINRKANETWGKKNVRFGYFDFIDDPEVPEALIKTVEQYGREHGMEQIIGPMGFTDMDREGMLIEGFDVLASMHGNHNYPYYPTHMERMGFEKDNDWVQMRITVPKEVPEKFKKITSMIGRRYNLQTRKLTKKQMMKEGYGERFFHILNETYKELYEYSELDEQQISKMLDDYIGMADMNLVSFIFDESIETANPTDKMIGFGVSFPSFSEALQRTGDGRLFPFGWYHLLRALYFHKTETVDLLLIGVLPEYRAKGANALLFNDLIGWYNKYEFKQALTLPMMESNDGVLSAWQYLDSHIVRRLRSYKKALA